MNLSAILNRYKDHIPVLLDEVIASLAIDEFTGGVYIDATFGAGGYTRALLSHDKVKVFAFDCDPKTKQYADKLTLEYGRRFNYINSNFVNLEQEMTNSHQGPINGIVFDLGVSSMQLDHGERGFSFNKDGPLDMRMATSGKSAADYLANVTETELAQVLKNYGEERAADKIAKKIIETRERRAITSTMQLAEIVHSVKPRGKSKTDPATKTFQAIRIAVNDEINNLEHALEQAWRLLDVGGRLSVVTFHGLEERVIKEFIKKHQRPKVKVNKYRPPATSFEGKYNLSLLSNKSVQPTAAERDHNPRCRSASLRTMIKEAL